MLSPLCLSIDLKKLKYSTRTRLSGRTIYVAKREYSGIAAVQGNRSGHRWAPCKIVMIWTMPPLTRYGTMYGVPAMTSSRVSSTRPGRPIAGEVAKRRTAVRIRSMTRVAADGLSKAMRSRISSSRRRNCGEKMSRRRVTAGARVVRNVLRPPPRKFPGPHRARQCRP